MGHTQQTKITSTSNKNACVDETRKINIFLPRQSSWTVHFQAILELLCNFHSSFFLPVVIPSILPSMLPSSLPPLFSFLCFCFYSFWCIQSFFISLKHSFSTCFTPYFQSSHSSYFLSINTFLRRPSPIPSPITRKKEASMVSIVMNPTDDFKLCTQRVS